MVDSSGRNIEYLRISVTDRCNLRCVYCMPECGIENLEHDEILTFKEIMLIVKTVSQLGIHKIKITGGEPLVRKGIVNLVRRIKDIDGIEEITMTTNGVLFGDMADSLAEAGLDSVNISLDTLNSTSFNKITRRDCLDKVKLGLKKAVELGLKTKINCVPIAQLNGDDLIDILKIAKENPIDVRFIELMPIGFGKSYSPVCNEQIFEQIEQNFGTLQNSKIKHGNGPAVYYNLSDFKGSIGFISAISNEFCDTCNRIRLTADGNLKLCLRYNNGVALKPLLRSGISKEQLKRVIENAIYNKPSHHGFNSSDTENIELKNMVQIGG
ncbi:cyclic pyranopterin phosphate synthase MoaA [Clostridium sp. MF28]|uniref:GTP 3',8-cyclase MoaA n=1 Tax=Clostridium TaxID=1485 RepID=UPI000CF951A9|nr:MULTISPECIES: GTP 3',8-cyclase MoaA [Clostridium]AVK50949.1 cyclic pyranopterin phosphate synthase MoaA [Clostridium sp. MF28]PSM56354.1 GTP 3',8-cyclase MoaA [Clostridium diolis]